MKSIKLPRKSAILMVLRKYIVIYIFLFTLFFKHNIKITLKSKGKVTKPNHSNQDSYHISC